MTGEAQLTGGESLVHQPEVTIVDMDAQTADLIFWSIVENGIRTELIPFDQVDVDYLNTKKAVIFSGGRNSVNEDGAPQIPDGINVPIMGICYGGQAIAKAYGGTVEQIEIDGQTRKEFGATNIEVEPETVMYGGAKIAKVLMSHNDSITQVPQGFRITGKSGDIVASFESEDGKIVATQFHPEVKDTEDGKNMLLRFLTETAGVNVDPTYTTEVAVDEHMEREEAKIAAILENGDLIRGFLSGGVDSRVAAELIVRVAKQSNRLDQVKFYYVDNGHTRIEDDEIIEQMIAEGTPVEKIEAASEFFHSRVWVRIKGGPRFLAPELVRAQDPELKRAIMGTIFRNICDRIRKEALDSTDRKVYFMQGTNASDIVESKEVKGHHNISAMRDLEDILIEPLSHLLKYHIRYLAESRYGLPPKFARRQPFPGPGFSPRIIVNLTGELEKTDPAIQSRIDEEIKSMVGDKITGHLVNMKSVGVKGDSRSVANAVFLTGEPSWRDLEEVAGKLPDLFDSVNRIFYVPHSLVDRESISNVAVRAPKAGQLDGVEGVMTADDERHAQMIREMEEVHRQAIELSGINEYLSQHYVATLPVSFDGSGKPVLSLRLFITGEELETMSQRRTGKSREDFRTGIAGLPGVHFDELGFNDLIYALQSNLIHHSAVAYDITSKPPGSVELE